MAKLLEGRDVILSIYDDTAYKPVVCLTSNSISHNREIVEGTVTKCDQSPSVSAGGYSYEISADGEVLALDDTDYADRANGEFLRGLIEEGKEQIFKMDGGNETIYGTAIITAYEETYPAEGKATFTLSMRGIGKITDTDPVI